MITEFRFTFLILLLITGSLNLSGQVKVRLYAGEKVDGAVIRVASGSYELVAGGKTLKRLNPGDYIFVSRESEGIAVSSPGAPGFITVRAILAPQDENSMFDIRVADSGSTYSVFNGTLHLAHDLGTLMVINETGLESYVAAVVEAEGGYNSHPQYYMAQAILVRTFAVINMERHADEGYDMCDDVHCQVFHGICSDPLIQESVAATAGLVVTGPDSTLLFAPFHSNCGGLTAPSDHSWLKSENHLQSVVDPYCSFSRNATWTKTVSVDDWIEALRANGFTGADTSVMLTLNFLSRIRTLNIGGDEIMLSGVRNFLGLRSSFFSTVRDGNNLIIRGRGYGHGVGLCQEGAMVMAERGFSFNDIITFYFRDVLITGMENARRPVGINGLF
ncbi:MAG: SpoIID/LytB domain-containing protein [Bacteroidales bacterium]|nr:SpoIID/LytB domain-containing protein [Bacteroidales bacterium]